MNDPKSILRVPQSPCMHQQEIGRIERREAAAEAYDEMKQRLELIELHALMLFTSTRKGETASQRHEHTSAIFHAKVILQALNPKNTYYPMGNLTIAGYEDRINELQAKYYDDFGRLKDG